MEIINCEQGTQEWLNIRCGIPTASNFDKIITSMGTPSKQQETYLYTLAGESISKSHSITFKNEIMERGIELESEARQTYEFITGEEVEQVGFCLADGYGCSPDGLIGEKGLLEIKCPLIQTHIKYLLSNTSPTTYFQQLQGQLFVTNREWVDFMSYYPELPPYIIRVLRDEQFISSLEKELKLFCKKIKTTVSKLKELTK